MEPAQARSAPPQLEWEWPAPEDDLRVREQVVTLRACARRAGPIADISGHGPRRPGLANLGIKPAPGIDDMHPWVNRGYSTEIGIADWLDDEHFRRCVHGFTRIFEALSF